MNIDVLEDWVDQMDLPRGVKSHFFPVRDLLTWLQVLPFSRISEQTLTYFNQSVSSIHDFSELVATIQGLRSLNPLQVGNSRALRKRLTQLSHADATRNARL